MTDVDDEALWIESTRDPNGEPVCLLTWGSLQWYADVAEVRKTAVDMVTCAASAEMMMLLVAKLELPGPVASRLLGDLISETRRDRFGHLATVTMLPAGSTKTCDAVVLLRRGSKRGSVLAASARSMALQWLEAAEATESDQLVSEALSATGITPDDQERLFGYLRELRKEPAR